MNRDFVEILSALCAAGAEFLIVGAHALAAHGVPRATGDLDLWVRPTPANADRVLTALRAFGAPLMDLTREDLSRPDVVFQVGLAPVRIDPGLRAERQGAGDRARLEQDAAVDEEARQAPSEDAAAVAAEDLEEHTAGGCQALAPCRIVAGAVVAPSWMARPQANPEIPRVSAIYPTACREKSSSASVFAALAWRSQ